MQLMDKRTREGRGGVAGTNLLIFVGSRAAVAPAVHEFPSDG